MNISKYWQYLWESRLIHFIIMGICNTIFSYSCFALFIYLGVHYTLAVFISTCFGILFSFNTLGRIVFKNHNYKFLIKFLSVYGVLYFVNIFLIKTFYSIYPNYYLAGALTALIVPWFSFFINKFWVFKGR